MKPLKRLLVDLWGRRDDDFNWRKDHGPLDPAMVESVLLLHLNGKLGDAIIDSLLLDALATRHPAIALYVGTTPTFERYWRAHPGVRDVAVFPSSKGRSALGRVLPARRAARRWRGRFGVVVSFESFAQPDHFALLRGLAPKTLVGFHKNRFRLFDYSLDEGRHGVLVRPIFSKIAAVMRVFGDEVDVDRLRFHVPIGEDDRSRVGTLLDRLPTPGPRLLLHTYGTGPLKRLSPEATRDMIQALRRAGHAGGVWVGVPEGEVADYETALRDDADVAVIPPLADAFALFALVEAMDFVVAPDTAIGHVAAALDRPQIVLFAGERNVPMVWRPRNAQARVLVAPPGRSVGEIDGDDFAEAARELLSRERKERDGAIPLA